MGRYAFDCNADLHCHSVVSDGVLTPTVLAHRAQDQGVALWALTDHDEVSGLAEAESVAQAIGLPFVPGVEISVSWHSTTIHVVGLGVDYHHSGLLAALAQVRQGRRRRAMAMADALAEIGIPGVFEGAMAYVSNPDLISRTHLARYLVSRGHCRDIREVFTRYMVPGKPGYVPHAWASLADAVAAIREAGGIAIIAHPGRYRLHERELLTMIDEFIAHGGEGIEVVTGNHTVAQFRYFAQLALERNLLASRGSDFHSPDEARLDLGALPPLPDSCVPVWTRL